MRPWILASLVILAATAAPGCSSGSSGGTQFVAPPAETPAPIGSWAGEFRRGSDAWPLTGFVEVDSAIGEGAMRGELSSPGDVTQRPFSGSYGATEIVGQALTWNIVAMLVDEPDGIREDFGFLYAGTFSSTDVGNGEVMFRVIPAD